MTHRQLASSALAATLILGGSMMTSGCSGTNLDAKAIEERYGVSGATTENILMADGEMMPATIVPVTLPNGQTAQLIIPHKPDGHSVYLRDKAGMHPVVLQDGTVSRDQFVRSNPVIVEQTAEPQLRRKRSWEKEALIIGGSAAAGAGIGAVAGGKKGAAIGAASGGVAGLIYDLSTRNK